MTSTFEPPRSTPLACGLFLLTLSAGTVDAQCVEAVLRLDDKGFCTANGHTIRVEFTDGLSAVPVVSNAITVLDPSGSEIGAVGGITGSDETQGVRLFGSIALSDGRQWRLTSPPEGQFVTVADVDTGFVCSNEPAVLETCASQVPLSPYALVPVLVLVGVFVLHRRPRKLGVG